MPHDDGCQGLVWIHHGVHFHMPFHLEERLPPHHGDAFRRTQTLPQNADENVRLVARRGGDESVRLGHAFVLEQFLVGTFATEHDGAFQLSGKPVTLLSVLIDEADVHPGNPEFQSSGNLVSYLSSTHDENTAERTAFSQAEQFLQPPDLIPGADYVAKVTRKERILTGGDKPLFTSVHIDYDGNKSWKGFS